MARRRARLSRRVVLISRFMLGVLRAFMRGLLSGRRSRRRRSYHTRVAEYQRANGRARRSY